MSRHTTSSSRLPRVPWPASCRKVRDRLGAFLDDELVGSTRLAVSDHLSKCESCAARYRELRELGDALRLESGFVAGQQDILGGLVGSVLSQIRAEQAQSWSAAWTRAFDDWHWPAVGLGSVAGGIASVAVAVAMVSSSVAALERMKPNEGTLYLMALPDDGRGRPEMMAFQQQMGERQLDSGWAMPASIGWEAERELTQMLDETLMRSGWPASLEGLSKTNRDDIVALLAEISDLRYQSVRRLGGTRNVFGAHLHIDTYVRASGP